MTITSKSLARKSLSFQSRQALLEDRQAIVGGYDDQKLAHWFEIVYWHGSRGRCTTTLRRASEA